MSNLGIHAIYGLLNSHGDVVCERVFWEENRGKNLPPLALESQRPLTDFAVLAFSVSYELDYLNVVQVLKASGIPLYAADRDERHPLGSPEPKQIRIRPPRIHTLYKEAPLLRR